MRLRLAVGVRVGPARAFQLNTCTHIIPTTDGREKLNIARGSRRRLLERVPDWHALQLDNLLGQDDRHMTKHSTYQQVE